MTSFCGCPDPLNGVYGSIAGDTMARLLMTLLHVTGVYHPGYRAQASQIIESSFRAAE